MFLYIFLLSLQKQINKTLMNLFKGISPVQRTFQYNRFKNIGGNRTKNLSHINRLRESMKQHYLLTIILVNEKFEIIDGQHRFEVIKELNLPLYYVVQEGYSLNEVHILNQNAKNWSNEDYLEGYCDLGEDNYIKFKEFKERYKLTSSCTMLFLHARDNSKIAKTFREGKFKVENYNLSCARADAILSLGEYYEGVRRKTFIAAMLRCFKNKEFSFEVFKSKLKRQSTSLVGCVNVDTTIELIEKIYNNRSK